MIRFTPSAWRLASAAVEQAADDVRSHAQPLSKPLLQEGNVHAEDLVGQASKIDVAASRIDEALAGEWVSRLAHATALADDDAARMVDTARDYEAIEALSADVWFEEV